MKNSEKSENKIAQRIKIVKNRHVFLMDKIVTNVWNNDDILHAFRFLKFS